MTVHPVSIGHAAEPPSSAELEQIAELRKRLGEIPTDLDTDLNLTRWIRGYHGDLDRIVKNMPVYIQSRAAAGFDRFGDEKTEDFFEMAEIKKFLPFIASSRLSDRLWNEERNCFLFVERGWSEPKEIVKVMKTSDYLLHCFGYSEHLLQLILRREKNQSPQRGPVQFVVIFDLATVNLMDYLNPMAAHMKLWKLRSDLWQQWYPDMAQMIWLVNPPRLVGILWRLAKLFLNERNCRLVHIANSHEDLLKQFPAWFLPKEFGGEWLNNLPTGDESGVSRRRSITVQDHYRSLAHYERHGVQRPPVHHQEIRPDTKFSMTVAVKQGQSLLWDFCTNGELDMSISFNLTLIYPQLRLVSTKLNEEGQLDNLEEGEYRLNFFNNSSYFNVKLDLAVIAV